LLINGGSGTHISALDRGLQYGDGLFETIAVAGSRPCLWQRHYQRLHDGGKRLGIPIPTSETILSEIEQEIGSNEKGVVKVTITRGEGARGYNPPPEPEATRIVNFSPWPDHPEANYLAGVRVRICETRIGTSHTLAGIKHLNRLEQVMARGEWSDSEISEGLMLDAQGYVIEGTMSNVFMLKDGVLHTPDLTKCGVEGVMRALVLDAAAEQRIEVNIRQISQREILQADGVFLTNSIIGIWPVNRLEDREYNIDHLDQGLVSEVMSRAYV